MKTLRQQVLFFVIAVIACSSWAQEERIEPSLRLAVDLADGSRVIGISSVTIVPVETAIGRIEVPLVRVSTMTFREDQASVVIELIGGDRLSGVPQLGELRVDAVFGQAVIDVKLIRTITFVGTRGGRLREGLVLWNRLESEDEVKESRIGPGGQFIRGRFVPGRFGKGIELGREEQFGVTFPFKAVPPATGCIEFWAKLVDFPAAMPPSGPSPSLIGYGFSDGRRAPMLQFNANDGASNGGLCIQLDSFSMAGTDRFGSWTYARSLGTDDAAAWHHYALVWDQNGVAGVGGGARRIVTFVDGAVNTRSWSVASPNPPVLEFPGGTQLGLLFFDTPVNGRVVFDNLKIWNFAKTDFADRDDE